MSLPIIATHELTKRFGTNTGCDRISFEVGPGEIFGLIGPNGAGKSTLVKMLTTLLPMTSGQATVAGFDLAREPARIRAHIGYVPQLLSADGALTGRENLLLSARLYLVPRTERSQRVRDSLIMMGLADVADRIVQGYSGGMIRRLEIAQSVIHRPSVLFMDEPTEGLDPVARRGVWSLMRNLKNDLGMTILVTTHLMEEAETLCERIGILHNGRLEDIGRPDELKAKVGPDATLDDVFARVTGTEIDAKGSYDDVRQARQSFQSHS